MKNIFYEKVLPKQGTYALLLIKGPKNQTVQFQRYADTLDDLMALVERYDREGFNTFVGMHTFNGYRRHANNAAFCKSFFLDLDVGPPDPKKKVQTKYPSKEQALTALVEFVDAQGLPPPVVVNSGGGVHAYWILDQEVPSNVWSLYAQRFKKLLLQNLIIDPAVPADRSRVLRVVGTHNYKTDPPATTNFYTDNFYEYSFDVFKEFLNDLESDPVDEMKAVLETVERGLDDDTASVAKIDPNFESVFGVLAQKSLDNEGGCAQIDYILREAATLSEPMWRAGLSIARSCTDWEEAIHIMSSPHPEYDREATISKAENTVGDDGRPHPYTCSTLEDLGEVGKCDDCPFRGKIKSPIQLAKRLKTLEMVAEAPTEAEAETEVDAGEKPAVWTTYPAELEPYLRGPNGGVWYKPPSKKDKAGNWIPQDEIQILPYSLYPIKRMYSGKDGETLVFQYDMPHDGIRTFAISGVEISSVDKFRAALAKSGVVIDNGMDNIVLGYVKKWVLYMQNWKRAEDTRSQMGWTEKDKSFVIGNVEYHGNGVTTATAASSLVHTMARALQSQGSFESWKKAANMLSNRYYEPHAFTMLCGFGSPILRLTPVKGGIVGLIGGTGAGKSGALYACASIYGNPELLCRAGAKDGATANGLTQWMMGLKNIPMTLDETSNFKPEEVSNLVYKSSQGQGKIRAQASSNDIRELELSAALITILTSNQSMADKLAQFKSNPDGELARYLELKIDKPPTMNNEEGNKIFDTMRLNYGHAGPVYVQYLIDKGDDYCIGKLNKWKEKFYKTVGQGTEYRFYESKVCSAFAGGELAMEAGIIDLDLDRIYASILSHILTNKDIAVSRRDYEEVLGTFQNEHQGSTLVLNNDKVIREPRTTSVVARAIEDQGIYYVARSALREYLSELQISEQVFVQYMEAKKILVYRGKQRLTSGWPGMSAAMSAVAVYGFHIDIPKEFFDDDED